MSSEKLPQEAVIGLYETHATIWQGLRSQILMEKPWLDRFLSYLPKSTPKVLDLGCGSGKPIAAYLIRNGCQITGVDGAAAMVSAASQIFPEHKWITADMRNLPELPTFDGLLAWHSFFHLPPEDQPAMFEVFRQLTNPGGVLMFTSGIEKGEVLGEFQGQPLYHGSLDRSDYQTLLDSHGFETLAYTEGDSTCGGANIWLAKCH